MAKQRIRDFQWDEPIIEDSKKTKSRYTTYKFIGFPTHDLQDDDYPETTEIIASIDTLQPEYGFMWVDVYKDGERITRYHKPVFSHPKDKTPVDTIAFCKAAVEWAEDNRKGRIMDYYRESEECKAG